MLAVWTIRALIALAAVVILYTLCCDAVRRGLGMPPRRRCPRCWHDLSHTPGLTCGECGHTARRERALHRSRRGWRLVAATVSLIVASHAFLVHDDVRDRGWAAAVPTTGLILASPLLEPDFDTSHQGTDLRDRGHDALFGELADRVTNESLAGWQEWLLGAVCDARSLRQDGRTWRWDSLRDQLYGTATWTATPTPFGWTGQTPDRRVAFTIETRGRWPVGAMVYGEVALRRSNGKARQRVVARPTADGFTTIRYACNDRWRVRITDAPPHPWDDGLIPLGVGTVPLDRLAYEVTHEQGASRHSVLRWFELKSVTRQIASISGTIDDVLEPVTSDTLDERLRTMIQPAILRERYGSGLHLRLASRWYRTTLPRLLSGLDDLTLAFSAEIMRGGEPVACARAWYALADDGSYVPTPDAVIPIDVIDAELLWKEDAGPLAVRIVADPATALRNFDCDRYWNGEIELPVVLKVRGPQR